MEQLLRWAHIILYLKIRIVGTQSSGTKKPKPMSLKIGCVLENRGYDQIQLIVRRNTNKGYRVPPP
jgi:hypothetical protein